MGYLAEAYEAAGQLDLALPLLEETLKLFKAKFGPEHPHTLLSMGYLAGGYTAAGKLDLAIPLFEETLKVEKAKFGPEHPNTLISMYNLAVRIRMPGSWTWPSHSSRRRSSSKKPSSAPSIPPRSSAWRLRD